MHKISVIITTYNSQQTIERLLDSIYAQKGLKELFDIEVIVVDDCSKDKTAHVVTEKYQEVLFHVNKTNSGGPNKGRNKGLNIASGDYICITDHDDEWLEDKILRQLECISLAPIISSGYILYDEERRIKETRVNKQSEEKILVFGQNKTFIKILSKNKVGQSTYIGSLMFHRSLKHILFEEKYGQLDFDWLLRLFENNTSVEVNAPLYNRYFDGSNLSMNEDYRNNDYQYAVTTLNDYSTKYPKESKSGIKRLNGSYARYFYKAGNMKKSRYYFLRSEYSVKTILYFITSFAGSTWVKKHFNVFG